MPRIGDCLQGFAPAILGTIAIVCGTAANVYCETVTFNTNNNSGAQLYAGVFSYRTKNYVESNSGEVWVFNTCRNYDYLNKELGFDYTIDSKTRTTMAFSILAPVIGALALFYSFLVVCSGSPDVSKWKCIGSTFLFTSVLQGLTLLMQSSSLCDDNPVLQYLDSSEDSTVRDLFGDECEWGPGYRLGITGTVFWILAGLSTFVIPPPSVSASEPVQTQTVTYQRNPDGTVEESNVVIVKGAAVADATIEEGPKKY